ncbi:MAG: hypothetical protein ABF553_07470 [Acetobacter orientalis]|uniref:hypothetical protein n=1 Tax=Acetobacter orientalis TaxID=146474 RepID=UPI0039EA35A6
MTEKLLSQLIRKTRRTDDNKLAMELDIPFAELEPLEGSDISSDRLVISAKAKGLFSLENAPKDSMHLDLLFLGFRDLVLACRSWPIADRRIDKMKISTDGVRSITFTARGTETTSVFTIKAKVQERAFSLTASETNVARDCSREVAHAGAFIVTLIQRAYQCM